MPPPTRSTAQRRHQCWWFGINNRRRAKSGHVFRVDMEPFLQGLAPSFSWPVGGAPPSRRYNAEMQVGDPIIFWTGDGPLNPEWGIIGFGAIAILPVPGTEHPALDLVLRERVQPALCPYPSGHPEPSPVSDFLLDVFGPEFRPLRKTFARLGHDVKANVITIERVTQEQFERIQAYSRGVPIALVDEIPYLTTLREGERQVKVSAAFQRSPHARSACIAHHGSQCAVCAFDFGRRYGALGESFIEVHHLRPLAAHDGDHEVDPIHDLIPLCANCHRMVHRRQPPYTPEELRHFIANADSHT